MTGTSRTGILLIGARHQLRQPITAETLAVLDRADWEWTDLTRTITCVETHCGAAPGEPCVNPLGHPMDKLHRRRFARAESIVRHLLQHPESARWADDQEASAIHAGHSKAAHS